MCEGKHLFKILRGFGCSKYATERNLRDFKVYIVESYVKNEHCKGRKLSTYAEAHHFLSPTRILVLKGFYSRR